jgi:hypothetical protein
MGLGRKERRIVRSPLAPREVGPTVRSGRYCTFLISNFLRRAPSVCPPASPAIISWDGRTDPAIFDHFDLISNLKEKKPRNEEKRSILQPPTSNKPKHIIRKPIMRKRATGVMFDSHRKALQYDGYRYHVVSFKHDRNYVFMPMTRVASKTQQTQFFHVSSQPCSDLNTTKPLGSTIIDSAIH